MSVDFGSDCLWTDVRNVCLRHLPESDFRIAELVGATARLISLLYQIALTHPELHKDMQQRGVDSFASLALTVISLSPDEHRSALVLEFARLTTYLHDNYFAIARREWVH
jgi:hypothetical protein